MKIFVILTLSLCAVQCSDILVKVIQEAYIGNCQFGCNRCPTTGNKSLPYYEQKLEAAKQEVKVLEQEVEQASSAETAVYNAGNATQDLVDAATGNNTGRHRRKRASEDVSLTSCDDPSTTINGTVTDMIIFALQKMNSSLQALSIDNLDTTTLECYAVLAFTLRTGLLSGRLAKPQNTTVITNMAESVRASVRRRVVVMITFRQEKETALAIKRQEVEQAKEDFVAAGGTVTVTSTTIQTTRITYDTTLPSTNCGTKTEELPSTNSGTKTEAMPSTNSGTKTEALPSTNSGTKTEAMPSTNSGTKTEAMPSTNSGTKTEAMPSTNSGTKTEAMPSTNSGTATEAMPSTNSGTKTEAMPSTNSGTATEALPSTNSGTKTEAMPSTNSGTASEPVATTRSSTAPPNTTNTITANSSSSISTANETSIANSTSGPAVLRLYCDADCGSSVVTVPRIVGGQQATPNEYPWQVLLEILANGFVSPATCGASIIKKSWLLTAAHCLVDPSSFNLFSGLNIRATFAEHDVNNENETQAISIFPTFVFVHPQYKKGPDAVLSEEHDIALLYLDGNLTFGYGLKPLCMPQSGDYIPEKEVIATGWGVTTYNGNQSNTLQEVSLNLKSQSDCKTLNENAPSTYIVTDNMICALGQNKDACQGDSGGPLITKSEDGRWIQLGIVSFGYKCAEPNVPGFYTNLVNYVDWITNVTESSGC